MNNDNAQNTDKSTELTGKEKRKQNLRPPWKKGDKSPNPDGRALGQRNYATLYRIALEKIAKAKGMSPEDLEADLIASGIAKAGNDYRFYKDMNDRLHGMATQKVDMGGTMKIENTFDAEQLAKIAGRVLDANSKK